MSQMNVPAFNKAVFSVEEFCTMFGIGRTAAYEEMKAGRLKVRKRGRRTLITLEDAQRWLAALPSS